ncbi:MAG: hypothetical protein ACI841_002967 [Planctomycetota bacterium]|jgi:hypothetical protein
MLLLADASHGTQEPSPRLCPPLWVVFLLALGTGCAGLQSERHLAPLFTQVSPAGGGMDIEAIGGALRWRRGPEGRTEEWALRPLVSLWPREGPDYTAHLLPPLGRFDREDKKVVYRFLPLVRYASEINDSGDNVWSLLTMIPPIYWRKTEDGRTVRAIFPIGGVLEKFLGFDRVDFALWPLFVRVQRGGRTNYHFPWPFFSYGHGEGGVSWRIWPLIGNDRWEGRYNRWFFLWPLFNWQHNRQSRSETEREKRWMVWPLAGYKERGAYRSYTFLWPFFGYAENEDNGWWAWDGPWPLVRFLEPGETGGPTRYRVWPLYSYYEGDGLTSRWYMWPLLNTRQETYADEDRETTLLLPFWQSIDDKSRAEGERRQDRSLDNHYRKLWPLFQVEYGDKGSRFAAPALNPLWRMPIIDYHYAWLYELYTRRTQGDHSSSRSWLGLYRREKDADENRRSFVGLWGQRDYSMAGRRVTERSFLFGLLRLRTTEGRGTEFLWPALPGPGWPVQRVPNSLLPRSDAERGGTP